MKLTPVREQTVVFDSSTGDTVADIFECADSYVAVLTPKQIDQWFEKFANIVSDENAAEYCDGGTTTAVFDIDGTLLTVVSDSGGELAGGDFSLFCEELKIENQFIIDSMDCTGVDVEDIYTGTGGDDYIELLKLVHKIYN